MSRVLEDEARDLPGGGSCHDADASAEDDRPSGRLVSLCPWIAVTGFAVIGIGWPLLGHGVFGPTSLLANWSPYRETVLAGVVPGNRFLQDVVDGVLPQTALFVDLVTSGSGGAWNPYLLGGVPLGAVPNNAFFNPLSLPFYLLPTWFAPAWVKVAEIAVSVGGTFLFARRLGLGRPAAVVGGLAFATSAFVMAWTGWSQSRTAAFVPVLFWAVERLATRRRVGDAALVCLAAAAMLLGGFPAVTGYALLAAGAYFLVRAVAVHRGRWRRVAGVVAGGVAAVAGAVGLAAFQLLPFAHFLSNSYIWGREQTPADHVPVTALITAIAPWSLGTTHAGTNIVEALSYVGAATLLLALVGVAAARSGRTLLPRGAWVFLVSATGVMVVLVYAGGAPLALAQRLPVLFADNFVGRLRSVLGFLVAVLAAVGFELVSRRQAAGGRWWRRGVWLAAGAGTAAVWLAARRTEDVDGQVLLGLAFVAVAAGCLALAWWCRPARTVALAGVPLLVAAQALTFAVPYWERADRDTFYPRTDVHRFLAEHLGRERYASPADTLMYGESSVHRLRSLNGHGFSERRMGELIEALPGRQFRDPPSLPSTAPTPPVVTSPIMDRLAVRYFVASTRAPVIGTAHDLTTAGPAVTLAPHRPVTGRVQRTGPLRALVVHLPDPVQAPTSLRVSLRDQAGVEVADGSRVLAPTTSPVDVHIPVTGEHVAPGTRLTATLTTDERLRLAGLAGEPALSTVAPAEDGLRVVMAEPAVVYERERALPRIRWAATAVVEPDPARRLELLADGGLAADQVLLDAGAGTSSGSDATVTVVADGPEAVEVTVTADGPGHLVVADALRHGWRAGVDGEPADLVTADHAVVAVPVEEGTHTVTLTYASPYHGAGTWLSAATGASLCALVVLERWWRRRQYPTTDVEPGNRD